MYQMFSDAVVLYFYAYFAVEAGIVCVPAWTYKFLVNSVFDRRPWKTYYN